MENLDAEKVEAYRQELAEVRVALAEANYDKKRLAVENDKLHASCTELARVQEENERLERICESYALQYGTATDKEVFLKQERADTVRKMQERIAEHATNGYPRKVRLDVIDQIAKELLEEDRRE